jgi:hypothetical protein
VRSEIGRAEAPVRRPVCLSHHDAVEVERVAPNARAGRALDPNALKATRSSVLRKSQSVAGFDCMDPA